MANPFQPRLIDQIMRLELSEEQRGQLLNAMRDIARFSKDEPNLFQKLTGMTPEDYDHRIAVAAALEGVSLPRFISDLHGAILHAVHFPELKARQERGEPAMATLEGLFRMGAELWEHSYKYTAVDLVATRKLYDYCCRRAEHGEPMFINLFMHDATQFEFLATALWAHYGFPLVELHREQIRELAKRPVTAEMAEEMRPPWRAFAIELAPGIFFSEDSSGARQELRTVLVHQAECHHTESPHGDADDDGIVRRWAYAINGGGLDLHNIGLPRRFFADDAEIPELRFTMPMTKEDETTHSSVRRIVAHLCRDRERLRPFGKAHSRNPEDLRASPVAVFRRFRLDD